MDTELEAIRTAVGKRRSRTAPVPPEILGVLEAYVRHEREKGMPWREVAAATGLSENTLCRRFNGSAGPGRSAAALVAVRVKSPAEGSAGGKGPIVVTPAGYRVEGLRVEEAAELLRLVG